MAQDVRQHAFQIPTLSTSYISSQQTSEITPQNRVDWRIRDPNWRRWQDRQQDGAGCLGSTGKGILIGMLSAFGSAALVALIIGIVYFFRYTNRGRILLDRIGRPGEFDDEQQFLREEEDALAEMDESQRAEYSRAKGG